MIATGDIQVLDFWSALLVISPFSGQQDGCPDFTAFSPADEAEPFGSGCLDGNLLDVDTHRFCEGFAHNVDIRSQLRLLEGDGDIHVFD